MQGTTFKVAQKITGQERKAVAAIIAAAVQGEVRYTGAPSFAYDAGGWQVSKDGVVTSPETDPADAGGLEAVMAALSSAGLSAEGTLCIALSAEGHTEATLRNVGNLLASKRGLLGRALGRDSGAHEGSQAETLTVTQEAVTLAIFDATLDPEVALAYGYLALKVDEMGRAQRSASATERETDNDKYAMRTWLLRLGFIGDEYKASRKVLMGKLTGDASFRHPATR